MDYAVAVGRQLLRHKTFPGLRTMFHLHGNTLLLSSDIVMDHKDKKELVRKFISPDLCDITEKLVLMEP